VRKTMSEEKQLQKMTESAYLFLEPGETIRAAAWGPSSELAYLVGVGSGRIAAVTEGHLYLFESPLWGRMSRPRGVVSKHSLGSAQVRLSGWVLHIGDERMVVHLHHRGRARRIAGLAADMSRSGAKPPADRRAG
jgi:hypothetical protein